MKNFSDYNPIFLLLYFLFVSGAAMFCQNPVITLLSFCGAFLLYIVRNRGKSQALHFYLIFLFAIGVIINPLFSHKGMTVLFLLNDSPITLESVVWGIFNSVMIISVIYWFASFSQVMTSDKLLYLFGSVSPKAALVVSAALRFIPLFIAQAKKINNAQIAMGLYKGDNAFDYLRGKIKVFSILLTWGLENGIITSDSMTFRGYGTGKRGFFKAFRFYKIDALLLSVSSLLFAVFCAGMFFGVINYEFYPIISPPLSSGFAIVCYVAYALLVLLPVISEISEGIRWKFLLQKI